MSGNFQRAERLTEQDHWDHYQPSAWSAKTGGHTSSFTRSRVDYGYPGSLPVEAVPEYQHSPTRATNYPGSRYAKSRAQPQGSYYPKYCEDPKNQELYYRRTAKTAQKHDAARREVQDYFDKNLLVKPISASNEAVARSIGSVSRNTKDYLSQQPEELLAVEYTQPASHSLMRHSQLVPQPLERTLPLSQSRLDFPALPPPMMHPLMTPHLGSSSRLDHSMMTPMMMHPMSPPMMHPMSPPRMPHPML